MNNCCTGMMVRTHGGSVWECMTPEQYNSFIESMNHPILRYLWLIILGVVVLLILLAGILELVEITFKQVKD